VVSGICKIHAAGCNRNAARSVELRSARAGAFAAGNDVSFACARSPSRRAVIPAFRYDNSSARIKGDGDRIIEQVQSRAWPAPSRDHNATRGFRIPKDYAIIVPIRDNECSCACVDDDPGW
jgi:hypothetical protein